MKRLFYILYKYPFLFFAIVLLLAYLPVFLPFFHLKNDLVTQNLPTRYVTAESLYSGFFPWWNPYIHFGIPMYGDMNNGFWNPVKWFIAYTTGYNIWTITLEEMFYVLIGGWGFYKLIKEFTSKEIALVAGLAYMCNGFILGHLQHFCWITGTGFFPFVLLFLVRLNKYPSALNFSGACLAAFLFIASTHPGLIIGAAYFLAFSYLGIFLFRNAETAVLYHRKFWIINSLLLAGVLLVCAVVLAGYYEALQYISRGEKVEGEELLVYPTTLQSYISLLFPLAVHKTAFFATDISMRNVYIGIAQLAGFLVFLRFVSWKIIAAVLSVLIFFVLLASGGAFKIFFSEILPGIAYVRLNGEFTYFAVLTLLLAGSAGLHYLGSSPDATRKILRLLLWIFIVVSSVALLVIIVSGSSVFYQAGSFGGGFKTIIKLVLDRLSFWDLLLINSLIQLGTIALLRVFLTRRKYFIPILSCNFIILTWLTLPFTGLGMESKRSIHSMMTPFPKGIHPQELISINQTSYIDPALEDRFWLLSSYSKKIGYPREEKYPVQLKTTESFFKDTVLFRFIKHQAYVFLSRDTVTGTETSFDSSMIHVIKAGPGELEFEIVNPGYGYLTLLQNNYPGWNVYIDGKEVPFFTGFRTFISTPMPGGKHRVQFIFNPGRLKLFGLLSLAVLIVAAGTIVFGLLRSRKYFPDKAASSPPYNSRI